MTLNNVVVIAFSTAVIQVSDWLLSLIASILIESGFCDFICVLKLLFLLLVFGLWYISCMFHVLNAVERSRVYSNSDWWSICVPSAVCSQSIILSARHWHCTVGDINLHSLQSWDGSSQRTCILIVSDIICIVPPGNWMAVHFSLLPHTTFNGRNRTV